MRWLTRIALLAAVGGCGGDDDTARSTAATAPPAGGKSTASALVEHIKSQTAPTATLRGTVRERIDASSYSYLLLATSAGELWVAVPQAAVAVGDEVEILNPTAMDGFRSETLDRQFDQLLFGTLAGAPGRVAETSPSAGVAIEPAIEPIDVERADGPNGHTVAEIHSLSASLAGQEVAVRGQVVKYTASVMNRNWLHIRDGSGSAEAMTDDLTVTTDATVRIGDEVLIRGRLATDRDFGAGYRYPVIVEEATVVATLRTSL